MIQNVCKISTVKVAFRVYLKEFAALRKSCMYNYVNTTQSTSDRCSFNFPAAELLHLVGKRSKRKVQGVPQSQTAAHPRSQEEEETDKSKQAQTEQTYEKH